MKKKNCWRKIKVIGENNYLYVKEDRFIRIFESGGQIYGRIIQGSLKKGKPPTKTLGERGFVNNKESIKWAKSYMKEHNQC